MRIYTRLDVARTRFLVGPRNFIDRTPVRCPYLALDSGKEYKCRFRVFRTTPDAPQS